MASALPPSPVKHGKLKVLECERKTGVWWPRGLRRRGGRNAFEVIRDLNAGLQRIIEKYCKNEPDAGLPLAELEASANEVFDFIGLRMWPTPEAEVEGERFEWLANARKDDLENFYPRDLYYAYDEDRSLLRRHFNEMVVARCIVYNQNHRKTSQNDRNKGQRSTPPAVLSDEAEQDEDEQDEDEQDEDEPYDTTYRTRRSAGATGTALPRPTSDADCNSRPSGGAGKRRGSTIEANNAKRQHDSRSQRLPPWKLIVKLKLSPHASQAAQAIMNGAGPQVGENSNPSTDASRSGPNEQPELASDPHVLERQHCERARASLSRYSEDARASLRGSTSSTAAAMGGAELAERLASVEYSDSLAAANRRGREEVKRARALRDSGMSKNTIEVLDLCNSDDPEPVTTLRRPVSEAEDESEKRAYDHNKSTALPVDRSRLEDTPGLQRKLSAVASAPSVSNDTVSKSIQAPPNTQPGADTRSEPTGPPSPAESQPDTTSPVASRSDPQPSTSFNNSCGTLENDGMATLERIDTEIDWTPLDKFPSSIPLQVCNTVQDFFAQIDDSRPQVLKQRRVHAAQVEHHNYGGAGQNVTHRIFREGLKGSLAFEKMLGRLKQYDGEDLPILKITVEWAS
ncbi:hypothetical protein LTR74_015827 [Friedmanniomyces endolithicus]|nr:hypothetical protein LTR74_015827 [Friedmanniomyces endolithicus]